MVGAGAGGGAVGEGEGVGVEGAAGTVSRWFLFDALGLGDGGVVVDFVFVWNL